MPIKFKSSGKAIIAGHGQANIVKCVLLFALILPAVVVQAQVRQKYIVKAGEVPLDVLPPEAIYTFPTFKPGRVYLRDGSISAQKLNYNLALDEMHFVNATNDTLAIAAPETIKHIIIDTSFFYFQKNYFQVTYIAGEYTLAKKHVLMQSPVRTKGGFEVSSSTSSVTTFTNAYYSGQMSKLVIKKDVELEKKFLLYIGDRFSHFYLADKKAFIKMFPEKKAAIEAYAENNAVNFRDESDLIKLLNFCTKS